MDHITTTTTTMSSMPDAAPNRLWIWQQNLNKSRVTQEDLINSEVFKDYDVLILQEHFIDSYGNTKATQNWRVVYPTSFLSCLHPIRAVILVKTSLNTNCWAQLSIPGTGNIAAIQISTDAGRVTLIGLYNDCQHSSTLHTLDGFLNTHKSAMQTGPSNHIFWCGDFNCHHPLWDEDHNKHLFTVRALWEAELLLGMLADHDMVMALPKDILTLKSMSMKNWTRPDNVFCTSHSEALLVSCTMDPQLRGPGMDHVPILIVVELPVDAAQQAPSFNFRMTDWDNFKGELVAKLSELPAPRRLTNEALLHAMPSTAQFIRLSPCPSHCHTPRGGGARVLVC